MNSGEVHYNITDCLYSSLLLKQASLFAIQNQHQRDHSKTHVI